MSGGNFNNGAVMFESVSNVTATPSIQIGARTTINGEDYLYVYNGGADTATKDHGVIITAMTGYTISLQSTTGVVGFVGLVKHADIPAASYGWVMTRGFGQAMAPATVSLPTGEPHCAGGSGVFSPFTGTQTAAVNGFIINGCVSGATADIYFSGF